jgi:DNA helicase HerA-like ATPase
MTAAEIANNPASVLLGQGGGGAAELLLKRANRHGLIAGATGTGKTVTLQRIAEGLAADGVPVFVCDVKGDLAGIAARKADGALQPAILWDVFGKQGHPIRATISEFGPLLLARLLDLNETQSGVLNLCFKLADDQGLLLLDLKDLRALLDFVADNAKQISSEYGLVSPTSVAAIQRSLLRLETEGAASFFGEPALELADLMRTDVSGRGMINILAADELMQRPRLYATFLLWLLAELFEQLPEAGDLPKPRLCLFFDEAHLLFKDAPKALLEKIELVVRLIRSKGVGVYFITQIPTDIPVSVAGQLGNRIQHALRAFTPADQKTVKAAADTFRTNPAFETREAILQLAVGEALVSLLDATGAPAVVERVKVSLPESRLGPLTAPERQQLVAGSPVGIRYDKAVDRESAYERLQAKVVQAAKNDKAETEAPARSRGRQSDSMVTAVTKSALRSAASYVGRELMRGIFGSLRR